MSEIQGYYGADGKFYSAFTGEEIDTAVGKVLNGEMDAAAVKAAQNAVIRAKSYSEGGTGTREGENEDNAKYYAQKAQETVSRFEADNEALIKFENTIYHLENVEVPKSLWKSDSTYVSEGFGFSAKIPCGGVTPQHFVTIMFSPEQIFAGEILPLCASGNGEIIIYAAAVQEDFVIPNIMCIMGKVTE